MIRSCHRRRWNICIPFRVTWIHLIAWMNLGQQKQNGKRKPVNIYIRWENCQIHATRIAAKWCEKRRKRRNNAKKDCAEIEMENEKK